MVEFASGLFFFAFLGVIFKRFVNYISVLKNYSPRILLSVLKVCVVIPTKIFKNLTNFVGVLNKPRSAEVCASFRLKNSKSTSKRQGFSFDWILNLTLPKKIQRGAIWSLKGSLAFIFTRNIRKPKLSCFFPPEISKNQGENFRELEFSPKVAQCQKVQKRPFAFANAYFLTKNTLKRNFVNSRYKMVTSTGLKKWKKTKRHYNSCVSFHRALTKRHWHVL